VTVQRFEGEAFDDKAAEAVEIYEVGELDSVTEGAAGGKDRISEAQRADLDTEINSARHEQ